MIAVITAGGKGTRLSSITKDIPKPMVSICGKPILEHQINCLKKNNIFDIYIIVGHLGYVIKDYFKDGNQFGVHIKYIQEDQPLGSAGALFYLKDNITDDFIFLFGDLLFDVYFQRMINFHKNHNSYITLLSHPNSHPYDSDLIICDNDNCVTAIDSKDNNRNYFYHNLVNAGIYIVSNKIFNKYFDSVRKIDFEKDIIFKEILNRTVYSYRSTEYVKDAGTPDRYYSVCNDVKSGIVLKKNLSLPQKCIFLDRDGTINKYVGFAKNIDDIVLEDCVSDALSEINKTEYLLIVITNQPVIARGDISVEQLDAINFKIETLLGKSGAFYDDLFYCPHHPDKGFKNEVVNLKIECDCRKPKIGLILKAKELYNIDLTQSLFVGDSTIDIKTAENANIKSVLVKTGLKGEDSKYICKPDYVINNLSELINIIKGVINY